MVSDNTGARHLPFRESSGILRGMATLPSAKRKPTAQPKAKAAARPNGRPRTHNRDALMAVICEHLGMGDSLEEAARKADPALHPTTVLVWIEQDPEGLGQAYAHARKRGYLLLGDKIDRVAAQTHVMATVHAKDNFGNLLYNPDGSPVTTEVLAPLSPDVIAHKRLVVDTMKWKLSKMLPKVYGDRVTQEHTGKDGGPIQTVNQTMDLRGLSDVELEQMNALLAKAVPPQG